MEKKRLAWIDTARGFIIIWVIFYQVTSQASHYIDLGMIVYKIAEFGRPVRVPALFFLSGMLAASSLQKQWGDYIRSKIIHLIFLFLLLTIIIVLMRFGGQPRLILHEIVNPQSSLWFIAVLPAFLLVARLCRDVPPPLMLIMGLLLELAHIGLYSLWTDTTSRYFIYFLLGMYGASSVYKLSSYFEQNTSAAMMTVLVFSAVNLVFMLTGLWQKAGIGFLLSCFSIVAVIAFALLLEKSKKFSFFRFAGKYSLIISLVSSLLNIAFFYRSNP